jgi:hypothetical protein
MSKNYIKSVYVYVCRYLVGISFTLGQIKMAVPMGEFGVTFESFSFSFEHNKC